MVFCLLRLVWGCRVEKVRSAESLQRLPGVDVAMGLRSHLMKREDPGGLLWPVGMRYRLT